MQMQKTNGSIWEDQHFQFQGLLIWILHVVGWMDVRVLGPFKSHVVGEGWGGFSLFAYPMGFFTRRMDKEGVW